MNRTMATLAAAAFIALIRSGSSLKLEPEGSGPIMVNTGKRYRYGVGIGCDSADGTTTAKYPKTIRDVLQWTFDHRSQEALL